MPPVSTPQAYTASDPSIHVPVVPAASVLVLVLTLATVLHLYHRSIPRNDSRWLKHCARPDEPQAQAKMVQHDTGYQVDTLDELWEHYEDALPRHLYPDDPQLAETYFYMAFVYIHYYPTNAQCPRVLWSPQLEVKGRGITTDQLKSYVLPTIVALALAMGDKSRAYQCIRWEDRLRHDNHTALLPALVTGAVDTGPVYVCQPKRSKCSRHLFQPKYHAPVYKFQLIISFLGHIVGYTGLHDGVEPDSQIWQQTASMHPMEPGELILADGIYIGQGCEQLLVKYDKDATAAGGRDYQATNDLIDLYRARVEHLMHEVSLHSECVVLTMGVLGEGPCNVPPTIPRLPRTFERVP
jgi:hypothetical protein